MITISNPDLHQTFLVKWLFADPTKNNVIIANGTATSNPVLIGKKKNGNNGIKEASMYASPIKNPVSLGSSSNPSPNFNSSAIIVSSQTLLLEVIVFTTLFSNSPLNPFFL